MTVFITLVVLAAILAWFSWVVFGSSLKPVTQKPVAQKNITVVPRIRNITELEDGEFVIRETFGPRVEKFEGWDIIGRVASLGVNMVPGAKMAFFPSIKVREIGYTYVFSEHNNVLVVMWKDETVAVEVPIGGDVEGNFKAAAERALKDIRAKYDKWLQSEKAREFAKAESEKVRDFASQMVIIGDKEEWKED